MVCRNDIFQYGIEKPGKLHRAFLYQAAIHTSKALSFAACTLTSQALGNFFKIAPGPVNTAARFSQCSLLCRQLGGKLFWAGLIVDTQDRKIAMP